jgi:hypothetical protein
MERPELQNLRIGMARQAAATGVIFWLAIFE